MTHSRIWDTFPTSKMEHFLTIGIYIVIFCRLMISYTLDSSMSLFICVSLLLVPYCSRWFHLQASEMVLFITITIANVVLYGAMMLHVQFLPMNVFLQCQFVTESISLQVSSSRWFQAVLGSSSSFQMVPARSSFYCVRK